MTRPDESQMISDLFEKREVGEKGQYKIYEALRDVKRVVDVYDTSHTTRLLSSFHQFGFFLRRCGNLY